MDPVARAAAQRIAQQAHIAPPDLTSLLGFSDDRDQPVDEDEDNFDSDTDSSTALEEESSAALEDAAPLLQPQLNPGVAPPGDNVSI